LSRLVIGRGVGVVNLSAARAGAVWRGSLSPVHTSNNVEATSDFVEATFDFVAENGNKVERNFFLSTKSKQVKHVQFRSTLLP